MDSCIKDPMDMPSILVKDGIITDVNDLFLELSCFSSDDLISKPLGFIWDELLRISTNPSFMNGHQEAYLFTKSLEAIHVDIYAEIHSDSNGIIYTFLEKPESRLDNKCSFLETIYSSGTTGLAIYSAPDLVLLKANRMAFDFLDKPYNEAANGIGRNADKIISGFKGSDIEKIWRNAVNTGEVYEIKEMPYEGFNRGTTYWNMKGVPIYEAGTVKYLFQLIEDVTQSVLDRIRLEKQAYIIKEQKEELEVIIQNMSDGVCVVDKEGNFIKINKAFKEFVGKNYSSEAIPRNMEAALASELHFYNEQGEPIAPEELPMLRVLKGERIEKEKIMCKSAQNESILDISTTPIFDNNGRFLYGIILVHDITHVVERERFISSQKEELEAIIENIDDAIFIYDKDNNHYMMNKAARGYYPNTKLCKYGDGFAYTKYYNLNDKQIPPEEMPNPKVRKGQVVKDDRIKIVQGDKERYVSVSGRPLYNTDGSMKLSLLHSRDITEDVKKEQIIMEQQELLLKGERDKQEALKASMELKDEFLYLMTHEFRTPITVINSALQAIELIHKGEINDKVLKYLKMIMVNNNRQLRLVNNLLDITRINSGNIRVNMSSFDIVHVVQTIVDSVRLYGQEKKITLNFTSTLEKRDIFSDDEKVERILLNLLANALKFTPSEKSINVTLSEIDYKGRKMISIEVQDEGIGIPKDKQKEIFERFGQVDSSLSRKAEGTGLGLYLVKLLIKALDGEIILESELEKGSTFTVLLPICEPGHYGETAADEMNSELLYTDERIFDSVVIEFSDVYL